ncbi:MAG: ATP-binding cassette domain-containing protein [Clostridia bacterium]|nr:ATP-binding cassette domain-containing protein [Clostridia bacterium]
MTKVIQIVNVTKTYGDKTLFKNLSLEFDDGIITSIMAPSGYGKTTLINMIAGLDRNYEGRINFAKIKQKDIIVLFQEDRLIDNLTVFKNLKLVCKNTKKIVDLLIDFDLEDKMDTKVRNLSGGEKRRIALIRMLLTNKKVMILDEPFNGLDDDTKKKIIIYLKKYQKENDKTFILVLHDHNDANMLSDKVIQLDSLIK